MLHVLTVVIMRNYMQLTLNRTLILPYPYSKYM